MGGKTFILFAVALFALSASAHAQGQVGAHCTWNGDCDSSAGLYCSSDYTCQPGIPNGYPCEPLVPCASWYCNDATNTCEGSANPTPTPTTPSCAPHCPVGAACTANSDCASGNCEFTTPATPNECAPASTTPTPEETSCSPNCSVGDPCTSNADCNPLLYCLSEYGRSTCAYCGEDSECPSGHCNTTLEGFCRPVCSPNCGMGDPCTDSTDCASLTCRGNGGGRVTATCQHCSQGFDCPSDHCNTDTGTCESCVPNCGINTTCNYDRDCASGYCDLDMETCQPSSSPTPTPTPACAPHCAIGANCTSDEDCDSGYCQPDMNTCQNPEICDNSLDDDHNNLIDCLDNTVCDCTETVSVTVTYPGEDGNPKPVVGATINFTYTADNVTNQTITLTTDDAGQAETDLNGLWEGNGIVYTKIYFEDADFKLMNSAGTDYYRSDVSFAAVNENDLQRDIPLGGNDRTVARIWDRLHEVYDFYTTGLGTNVDYQMPEEIYLMTPGVGGRHSIDWTDNHDYGITFGDIVFGRGFGAKESPQNQEWHEFNHHAMAAIYGGWWDTHAIKNHLGWGNPFSDDSYVEAFAEFMSMVETAHYASEYPRLAAVPSVYYYAGTAANLEKNYKVNNSRYEELAIASILWDLYDPPSNSQIDKDHIQIEWDVLWQVLSGQHEYSDGRVGYIHSTRDLYEAVWALNMSQFNMMYNDTYEPNNDSWMDKANALDKIFIAHGAFYDKNGNGIWDGPEEMVGYTSKQGNPGMIRSDLEPPPGSYVHANVNNGQVQNGTVKVKVTHPGPYSYLDYEYEGDFQDGLIAIDPPFDVPTTWEMNITSKGYSESAPVTVTSEDYNSKYNETNGYFDSVAVSIRPIATPTPAATRTPAPHSTPCSPYCGTGKSCTSNYDCASDYCDPATGTCQPATTPSSSTSSCCTSSFILAALGGLVYISKKSGLKSAE